MKRSDALSKIWDITYEISCNNIDHLDGANMIMAYLEEIGMTPPVIKNPKLPKEMTRLEFVDIQAHYSTYDYFGEYSGVEYEVNEWEVEDESSN